MDMPHSGSDKSLEKTQRWRDLVARMGSNWSFEEAQGHYRSVFTNEPLPIAWLPDEITLAEANIVRTHQALNLSFYEAFYHWSINYREQFWETAIRALGIRFQQPYTRVLNEASDPDDVCWLPDARLNIADSCFQAPSDQLALVVSDEQQRERRWTYGELEDLTRRVAAGLVRRGLAPGDRILLYMPLSAEAVATYLGTIRAGMVAVLVADSFSATELERRIALSEAKLVVTVDQYQYNGKSLVVYNKVKQAAAPPTVLVTESTEALREEDTRWQDFLGEGTPTAHTAEPNDLISILFSSGTTQEPKAIPWTHLTPIKCATDGYFHHDIHPTDVVTWTTGMGWMMGPWLVFATLLNNATLALFTGSAASAAFGKFMEGAQVTVLGIIPSLVRVWRSTKTMESYRWPIRVLSSTGEPSNADDYLYLMWLTGFRAPIIEYCGGTEIGGGYLTGSVVQPASPATFTTPTLGTELRFRDETGTLAPAQAGEVFIVPPAIGLSQRLLNRDHRQEYYEGTPALEDGHPLRKHGDNYLVAGKVGNTLFYRSRGRSDDTMNLGGIKVSAVEIEKVLNQHPAVRETAAVAMAPGEGGPEQLVVHYVPQTATDKEVLKKELQRALSTQLNPLFRIHQLVAQSSLPRTASNKLMRRALR